MHGGPGHGPGAGPGGGCGGRHGAEGDDAAPGEGGEGGERCRGTCFLRRVDETAPLFELRRSHFSLGVIGSLQVLVAPFVQNPLASIEAGSIANAEGFRLRRARFGAEGELPLDFSFRILFQHGDGAANILDAYVAWEPHPLARLTAGALKVPFSESMLRSSELQTFLQRPYAVREIAPDRALGFQLSGSFRYLSYAVGVFNGGGDFYRGDNNAGMLYAARLAAHPFGPPVEGEVTQAADVRLQVAGSYFFNQDATGDRQAANADVLLQWQRLVFRAEFLWSSFTPSADPETGEDIEYGSTRRMGWFAEAGVFVINEHLQVAVRYEASRILERGFEVEDLNDLWAIGGAVNGYFLRGRIKLSLEYEHRREWFDPQVSNDWLALQLQGRI
jgi:hypothetical protein